jgi:hypothetical protein
MTTNRTSNWPRWAAIVALCVALVGCAKWPADPLPFQSRRLIFIMTLNREINPNYVYIVALRPSVEDNPPEQGPVPVIAPPWGNGFVAGTVSHFVRWDPLQSPNYLLYAFRGADLIEYFPIGVPIQFEDVIPGTRMLRFELEVAQLAPTPADAQNFRSLQINFLTMDRVPQGQGGTKFWDALGDGRLPSELNTWITVPLITSGLYTNQRFNFLEPSGDTPDPDLDIVDWSVEVRLQ